MGSESARPSFPCSAEAFRPEHPARRAGAQGATRGQAATEYILSTMMILVLFTSLYALLQQQTRKLFTSAARVIVHAYHDFD